MRGRIMTDPVESTEKLPGKKSKLPLIIGLVLAIVGGGGGFFSVQSGMLFGSESPAAPDDHATSGAISDMPDVAFVPVDPLVISMGQGANGSHLRFRAQLEVGTPHKSEVEMLMPRVVDVLNSYLRALEPGDLESTSALVRLRAQMLRRVQIVTGAGRINDLLIMEFVLN